MKDHYGILSLCENLEVSPSGYYGWQQRRATPGPRAQENEALSQDIQQIHQRSRGTYGSPRIVMELRKKGKRHGRNRIARLMNEEGLCGCQKGRFRVRTVRIYRDLAGQEAASFATAGLSPAENRLPGFKFHRVSASTR